MFTFILQYIPVNTTKPVITCYFNVRTDKPKM